MRVKASRFLGKHNLTNLNARIARYFILAHTIQMVMVVMVGGILLNIPKNLLLYVPTLDFGQDSRILYCSLLHAVLIKE